MRIVQPVSKEDMSDPKAVYSVITPSHPFGMIGYFFWPFNQTEPHPIKDCMFMPVCLSTDPNGLVRYNDYYLATEIKTVSYWEGVNLDELLKLHNWPDSSPVCSPELDWINNINKKVDEVK